MWTELIKSYWRVTLLKQDPGSTPYSPFMLGLAGLIFFILIILQWMMTDITQKLTLSSAVFIAGSLVLSYLLYTLVLLSLYRLQARCIQTLTCLFAGHTIVHLAAFPLLVIMPFLIHLHASSWLSPFIEMIYLILTLILTIWQFMVSVYIYKNALMVRSIPAILASFGLLACNILTVSLWR